MAEDIIASPGPHGPRSDRARLALAALGGGLAVVLIGAGAVAVSGMANADTSASPTPSASGSPDGSASPPGPGRGHGRMGGPFGGLGGFGALGHVGDPLHGSAVVKDDEGNFVTYQAQRGEVTAVSASSISVQSEDGYEQTYVVDENTVVNRDGDISQIEQGDEVLVVATQDGGTSTATRVVDLTALKDRLDDMKKRFEDRQNGTPPSSGPWHRGDQDGSGGGKWKGGGSASPAPTPSGSATT